jgi:hypothetical protein
MMMLTTPFILPIIAPMSLGGAWIGSLLWTLVLVACIVVAVRLLWTMHGRPTNRLHLLCYLFAPTIFCVFAGQSVVLVMIGLVAFLWFHRWSPLLAGAGFALAVSIKPHLFIVFGIVLVLWTLARRRYALFAGVIAWLAALGLCATLLDPLCWTQYFNMMRTQHLENIMLPNLSMLFRLAVDANAPWLQLVPAALGSLWAVWYARRHQDDWDWLEHGSLLMIVSVMVAPYSWFSDEVTLMPALLCAVYAANRNGRSLAWAGVIAGVALLMVFFRVPINLFYFTWTPIFWLATYLYAVRPKELAVANAVVPTP